MAFPARRVVAFAVAARCRPAENALDAAADARGGFRLGVPYRLDRAQHEHGIDFVDWEIAKDRKRVIAERLAPLALALAAAPSRRVRLDIFLGAFSKGCGCKPCRSPCSASSDQGVNT